MGANGSRAAFIDNQRGLLQIELTQNQQRLQVAQAEVRSRYVAAHNATAAMRAPFKQALLQARQQARLRGRQGTWLQTLTLRALSNNGVVVLLIWAMLAGLYLGRDKLAQLFSGMAFPLWLLAWPMSVLPLCFVLYPLLVWWGRRRLGNSRAAAEIAMIDQLGRCQLQPHAFGQKHSDGRPYPYPAVRVPSPDPADPTISWDLFEKHDNSHAVLIGINRSLDKNPDGFLRLPFNGQPSSYIVISEGMLQEQQSIWSQVCQAAAPSLAEFAMPIVELRTACDPLEREIQIQQSLSTRLASLDKLESNWKDVAIPEDTLEQVIKLVDRFVAGTPPLPKGMLLWGPPGTGKTLIARKLAQHVNCHFKSVTIADLKGEYIGQTGPKVKNIWDECRKNAPTILFVDECESAFARRGGRDSDAFGNELVQTFIAEWDGFNQGGGNVLVIGATNRRELLDDAVMSRFTTAIELPAPNADSRERILNGEFAKANLPYPSETLLVRETSGMSGRDLATLVTSVVSAHTSGRPAYEDFIAAVSKLRGKSSTSVDSLSWDDVILPAKTRREFESLGKELVHAEELAKMNMPVPRGILLYGPPGTGKTQVARVLASQSGLSFMAASSSDIKASYIGASGEKVKQLFEKARAQAPCILFLDELDTVARSRDVGDVMTTEIVAQMLQELDGISTKKGQVFLLAASNHPGSIDSALLSRLERKIEIGLPDQPSREAILRLQLSGKPLDFDLEQLLPQLAQATDGKSGRDLQSLVTAATRSALQRAMIEHGDPTKVIVQSGDLLEQVQPSGQPA